MTDKVTGLMWEKKTGTLPGLVFCYTAALCPDPHDVKNLYQWGLFDGSPSGTLRTIFQPQLNLDSTTGSTTCFANYCDWRIPNISELMTIVDTNAPGCGSGSPCIDPIFGPTQAATTYWTSTSRPEVGIAWFVDFIDGTPNGAGVTGNRHARAVRGGR